LLKRIRDHSRKFAASNYLIQKQLPIQRIPPLLYNPASRIIYRPVLLYRIAMPQNVRLRR